MIHAITNWVRNGGFIIALIGFIITRFVVADSLAVDTTTSFVFGGLVPLTVGLALTIYGVILAIGPFTQRYVNRVTYWCVLGTVSMLIVLLVTFGEPIVRSGGFQQMIDSQLLIANVLLGGAVGGTITGIVSAKNKQQQREIQRQSHKGTVLNRQLRHEIINAASIIDGYTSEINANQSSSEQALAAINTATTRINDTISNIGRLTDENAETTFINLNSLITETINDVSQEFPETTITFTERADVPAIPLDTRIRFILEELITNAAAQPETATVRIDVTIEDHRIRLLISDDGPGLPTDQRELLESRLYPEYDDPGSGFGLQFVRLLISEFNGAVTVRDGIGKQGTTIEIELPQTRKQELSAAVSVTFPNIYGIIISSVLAGIAMGWYFTITGGQLPVIGALYGVNNFLVGWVTHLFHSIVFGLLFAGALTHQIARPYTDSLVNGTAIALGWGLILWLFAAGIIMPIWLNLVGITAPIPTLTLDGLVSHLLWAVVLGPTYFLVQSKFPA